ncbi:TfdA family oxidoreductase [Cordyceps fumosorosea ARSEF 2679]|uniref:TfdA family oxidoreductase n=1 Tax=Cordyceps fumosorosea (strain ARSEF 2679) TaxID=1081104 RepID=A0A162LNE1_CORFA|nr:TfdA family oxidoreductase [Cordyceps fumosorosea ARSEF 2679]OAA73244.1 TfdA family oxidoreductase [Cordyceps fumosorosea ARSEF 2679]
MAPIEIEQVTAIDHAAQQGATQCNTPAVSGQTDLPSGFPSRLDSAMSWAGSQYPDPSSYATILEAEDLKELDDGLEHFLSLGLAGDLVSKSNFPLQKLSKKLEAMQHHVYNGRGFALLRGFEVDKYSVEDFTTIFLGVQCHIGNKFGRQDDNGNMLVHIIADNSSPIKAHHHRHSTAPITFHNEEAGDVISWLTRNTAASGGKCIIASAHTIYNVLAATRPDLIRVLARSDWPFALPRFHCRPVLQHHDGKVIFNFGRAALMGSASHPRPASLPKLTPIQVEALDAIEAIACETQLEMQTAPGDIHFINNFAVLHRREGFVDGEATRRHLVRMRLRDDELGWAIPEELKAEWDETFSDKGQKLWFIDPMPPGFFPLRKVPN